MKETSSKARAEFMDRWMLMEKGRKLHDEAIFETLARIFKKIKFPKVGFKMGERDSNFHQPLMKHQAR